MLGQHVSWDPASERGVHQQHGVAYVWTRQEHLKLGERQGGWCELRQEPDPTRSWRPQQGVQGGPQGSPQLLSSSAAGGLCTGLEEGVRETRGGSNCHKTTVTYMYNSHLGQGSVSRLPSTLQKCA